MKAPEHSPLPWRDDGFGMVDWHEKKIQIYGSTTELHSKECANRRLIVRAVNSHDAILAAAKMAFGTISRNSMPIETHNALKDAIAAAEEPAP